MQIRTTGERLAPILAPPRLPGSKRTDAWAGSPEARTVAVIVDHPEDRNTLRHAPGASDRPSRLFAPKRSLHRPVRQGRRQRERCATLLRGMRSPSRGVLKTIVGFVPRLRHHSETSTAQRTGPCAINHPAEQTGSIDINLCTSAEMLAGKFKAGHCIIDRGTPNLLDRT